MVIDFGKEVASQITDAKAPFDNPRADVILRSSDNVDFRVVRSFLSYASPFFEGMFALPQPQGQETRHGLPIIPVEEKSDVIEKLLVYSYPVWLSDVPALQTVEAVLGVLEASIKYGMEGVEKRVRQALVAPPLVETEPMRVFAIAYRYKLADEVKIAAKHTLARPVGRHLFVRELDHIPATAIHRLLQYHLDCGEAAAAVAAKYDWIPERHFVWLGKNWHSCAPGPHVFISGGRIPKTAREWWMKYMHTMAAALRNKPLATAALSAELMAEGLQEAKECGVCRNRVEEEMKEFSELFATEVGRAISDVTLQLDF